MTTTDTVTPILLHPMEVESLPCIIGVETPSACGEPWFAVISAFGAVCAKKGIQVSDVRHTTISAVPGECLKIELFVATNREGVDVATATVSTDPREKVPADEVYAGSVVYEVRICAIPSPPKRKLGAEATCVLPHFVKRLAPAVQQEA